MSAPISLPKGYQRLDPFPLDATSIFPTYELLVDYAANNPTAYAGQICSVSAVDAAFLITKNKTISTVGGNTALAPSGINLFGDLTVFGEISGLGTITAKNGFEVFGYTPSGDIVLYVDENNVGIKTNTPNKALTVKGEISASDVISSNLGNSNQWSSVYTSVQSNSANWTGAASSSMDLGVRLLSANWQNTFSTTSAFSANWSSVYSNVQSNSANYILDGGNTKGSNLLIGTNDNFNLALETNNTPRITILNSGNVGIGTTSPSERLTVSGNISASGNLYGNASLLTNVIDTSVRALSGKWDNTSTVVQTNSARWVLEDFIVACSDESTNLTTSTSAVTFRVPFAMVLNSVRASVNVAPVGSTIIIDISAANTSIFSTKLSIDENQDTSVTASIPAVISNPNIADDERIRVAINQVGSVVPGAGLKVTLKGYRV